MSRISLNRSRAHLTSPGTYLRPVSGGVDQVRLEGHPRDPHAHGGAQPAAVRHPQRAQHLEAARLQRAEERLRHLHVSDQHRPDAQPGESWLDIHMSNHAYHSIMSE